ncbi:MAG: transcription termination/antitermination protein NusA [Spirochaetes bacterium RBG_16_67_19]|nr:MAG: transcription termination/antitermination protein NusA [Spirochaetes bacterium RBG_16_67_19]
MASKMSEAIKLLIQERGISEELVRKTIEESLLAAFKKKYGSMDNAVVRFSEDGSEVTIFARKKIVEEDDLEDPLREIPLPEAVELNEECEVGDELLIEINPLEFDRGAVQSAKQKTKQTLREIQKNTLYSEFKEKVGEMVIGYYQRERNGNIYVDLGKTEGILPKKYQSPREVYHPSDRVRALIYEVAKSPTGLQIVLSRTHAEFVRKVFELEVPELYDHTIEIYKIVREPGYRTKMAVYSNREDVDPVGACVGLKGVRIQAVVRELEGEKIDVLKYDPDPRTFIRNALLPAEVEQVVVLDEAKKSALAVVQENQFSLAIGKQGLNVRLANRLVDWNIDVKTAQQFSEMDMSAETKRALSALFGDLEPTEEISRISELPGLNERLVDILKANGIEYIESLISMSEKDIAGLSGVSPDDAQTITKAIAENIEVVEESEAKADTEASEAEAPKAGPPAEVSAEGAPPVPPEAASPPAAGTSAPKKARFVPEPVPTPVPTPAPEQSAPKAQGAAAPAEETYECPECGAAIRPDMTACPNCGVGLSFEEDEGQDG